MADTSKINSSVNNGLLPRPVGRFWQHPEAILASGIVGLIVGLSALAIWALV